MLLKSRQWRRRPNERQPRPRAPVATAGVAAGLLLFCPPLSSPSAAEDVAEATLGGYPLCEASAALALPCPDAETETCFLAGDNEVADRLFLLSFDDKAPDTLVERREIPMLAKDGKSDALSDIEAAVELSSGELLIYGSHSRDKRCDPEKDRRLMLRGKLGAAVFEVAESTSSDKPKCKNLFGVSRETAQGNMKDLCERIHQTEDEADDVDDKFDKGAKTDRDKEVAAAACNKIEDFNLEGAVAVRDGDEEVIWVGLRAPLVDNRAVLMRQRSRKAFEFDAVVFLDLHGAGIRELSAAGDDVWVIAGPPNDPDDEGEKHTLWRFPQADLAGDRIATGRAQIAPNGPLIDLPASAEGLVIRGDKAFVTVDGKQPESVPLVCETISTYGVYPLP